MPPQRSHNLLKRRPARRRRAPEAAAPEQSAERAPQESLELLQQPEVGHAARAAALAGLQRSLGNAAVERALAQRDPEVARAFEPAVSVAPASQRPALNQEVAAQARVTNAGRAPRGTTYEWSWARSDPAKLEVRPPARPKASSTALKARTVAVGESEAVASVHTSAAGAESTVQAPPLQVAVAQPKAKFAARLTPGQQGRGVKREAGKAYVGDTLVVRVKLSGIKKPKDAGLTPVYSAAMTGDLNLTLEKHEWEAGGSFVWSVKTAGAGAATIDYAIQVPGLAEALQHTEQLAVADYNQERFAEIKAIAGAVPTGQEALTLFETHHVGVTFQPGGGSYFDPDGNTMVIDQHERPATAALTFVHEMNHARYHHEGKTADLSDETLPRKEYVRRMVEEEAEGTVKSIEAKVELEGTAIDVSKASFPLEGQYRRAFAAAVRAAKKKDPATADDALKAAGRAAGKDRVTKGFMRGEVLTSNTSETYPRYYGKAWDKAHKKKK